MKSFKISMHVLIFFFLSFFLNAQETDTVQVVSWMKDKTATSYHIIIQDEYRKTVFETDTEQTFAEVSLKTGTYFFNVISYDKKGKNNSEIGWNKLIVLNENENPIVEKENRHIPIVFSLRYAPLITIQSYMFTDQLNLHFLPLNFGLGFTFFPIDVSWGKLGFGILSNIAYYSSDITSVTHTMAVNGICAHIFGTLNYSFDINTFIHIGAHTGIGVAIATQTIIYDSPYMTNPISQLSLDASMLFGLFLQITPWQTGFLEKCAVSIGSDYIQTIFTDSLSSFISPFVSFEIIL